MAQDKRNPTPGQATPGKGPEGKVQGEGDYAAARRYEEKLREHVQHHDVEKEARDAEPSSQGEEREMEQAEEQGKRRAKEEDALLERPEDIKPDAGKPGRGGSGRK